MRSGPRFNHLFLAIAGVGTVTAALRMAGPTAQGGSAPWILFVAIAATGLAAGLESVAKAVRGYFIALGVHAVGVLVCVALSGADLVFAVPLLCVFTLGVSVHNPFPLNLWMAAAASALVLALGSLSLLSSGLRPATVLTFVLVLGILVALVSLFASLMVRYRESLIDSQEETRRLDGLVDRLARANLRYQEYAQSVQESSTENERKRITRDIHDIVGYTLTNNITMMEAVIDTMRINPLGVEHLVEVARQNAQEGLARARDALHQLRRQEVWFPRGRQAVERLLQVFEHATGVRTEMAFTDVSWAFPDEVDSALYHIVQESLMNAFRHGKATVIRLFLSREGGDLVLRIRDNGMGAEAIVEGIGLSGMRERLERLGGQLAAGNAPGGFDVVAWIPEAHP